jgi:hypothetical protein
MTPVPMIPDVLAVIRGDDDNAFIQYPFSFEEFEQISEDFVQVLNLSVIKIAQNSKIQLAHGRLADIVFCNITINFWNPGQLLIREIQGTVGFRGMIWVMGLEQI